MRTLERSFVRSGGQSVSRAVLIEYSRAGRRSKAMKLKRELVHAAGVRGRRASSCASARKLFFSSARMGWGSERGRGLAVIAVILLLRRKNGILILGSG